MKVHHPLVSALLLFCLTLAGLPLLFPPPSNASLPADATQKELRFTHLQGDGELALHNLKTGETQALRYRQADGAYDYAALQTLNQVLRCCWKNEVTMMDLELIELLDDIQDHFGAEELQVISGYRSPEYNEHLASLGRKVAKGSLHTKGLASDIRIAGVKTARLRDYAKSLQVGGVGYYPQDGFVHVDVGRVRYW